jgi:hypothetical protein
MSDQNERFTGWKFPGYHSASEGRPVQDWLNDLPEGMRDEIADFLNYMKEVKKHQWRSPEFDPLDGAGGISELRPPDYRDEDGSHTVRLYGYFGPSRGEYTILHGTVKKVRNDKNGKRIAKQRMERVESRTASTHELDFEGVVGQATRKGPRSTGSIC